MNICRADRVNASKYLEWIGNSFDDLFLASPLVAHSIYTEYVKVSKENGMTFPDEYQLTINVNKEYQLQKVNELKDSSIINNVDISEPKSELRELKEPESKKRTDITLKGNNEIIKGAKHSHISPN